MVPVSFPHPTVFLNAPLVCSLVEYVCMSTAGNGDLSSYLIGRNSPWNEMIQKRDYRVVPDFYRLCRDDLHGMLYDQMDHQG